jgi:aspartyl-tRNA(Asn)/glutamyl-tRNA(Gln) amidotransferase subunit A
MTTLREFADRLRAKQTSVREATEECLRRIAANEPLNAFILVMADQAREQAKVLDRELEAGHHRGPLHGVPVSIKDLIDIEGTPTTAASRVREFHLANRDAPVIAHLRKAGAVFVGKTNLHEFAFGTTNEDSAYGPARNPHDQARSPGGSSGGSAISIVTGMALASVGTDTGGSIRIPAAACGCVGLKAAYGEVDAAGVVPLSRTLDHVGPIVSNVADAWLMHQVLRGSDQIDPIDAPDLRELRFGILRDYFCDIVDEDVRTRFERSLDALRAGGGWSGDASIPHAALIAPVYMQISFGDAAAYHAATLETAADLYTQPVRLRLELARTVLAEDYVRALTGREVLRREVDAALSGCDALLLPTLPIPAPLIGANSVAIGSKMEPVRPLMLRLTQLFNLTGHPAISLPCGVTASGLPIALQIVARDTRTVVRVALAVERALDPASRS